MTEIIKLENELLSRLKLKKQNNHVYYAQDYPFLFQWNDIKKLIELAREKSVYKLRVCLHQEDKAMVHEMIMMLLKPRLCGLIGVISKLFVSGVNIGPPHERE